VIFILYFSINFYIWQIKTYFTESITILLNFDLIEYYRILSI